jgi:hypothetical protein
MKGTFIWVLLLAAALLFNACSAQTSEQLTTNPDPTWAGSMAQLALSQQMDKPLEEVEIIKFQEAIWPDTCLGIPKKGETCTEEKLPGYSMEFAVSKQLCQVRGQTPSTVLIQQSARTW